jgi:DNA-binding NarL/FixJ family response regulator
MIIHLRRNEANGLESRGSPSQADLPSKIRVLIADDHPLIRKALTAVLEAEGDIEVVGDAPDGRTAVELARLLRPDVVVMDVSMPELDGVEATRQITREFPEQRVIGHSMHVHEHMADLMQAAGAAAYLEKDGSIERLLAALRNEQAE